MDLSEFLYRVVRVYLGSRQVGVAQQLLHSIQVGTVLQHVCREGVAQARGGFVSPCEVTPLR